MTRCKWLRATESPVSCLLTSQVWSGLIFGLAAVRPADAARFAPSGIKETGEHLSLVEREGGRKRESEGKREGERGGEREREGERERGGEGEREG